MIHGFWKTAKVSINGDKSISDTIKWFHTWCFRASIFLTCSWAFATSINLFFSNSTCNLNKTWKLPQQHSTNRCVSINLLHSIYPAIIRFHYRKKRLSRAGVLSSCPNSWGGLGAKLTNSRQFFPLFSNYKRMNDYHDKEQKWRVKIYLLWEALVNRCRSITWNNCLV